MLDSSTNPIYYISQIYALISGHSIALSETKIEQVIQYALWSSLGISLIFFVLFVKYWLACTRIEEEMGKKRFEAEVAQLSETKKAIGKNARWLNVERLANSTSEGEWRRAIIEGDSILGDLLKARGFSGKDIGEQLSGATKTNFGTLDLAWEAHKLRNRIAHEGELFRITERDAQATIEMYRRVFEEFGYLETV